MMGPASPDVKPFLGLPSLLAMEDLADCRPLRYYLSSPAIFPQVHPPQSVYALSTRHYVGEDVMETDNYLSVQIHFESGALGWVDLNQLMVNPRGFPSRVVLTIIGTKGTLVWDNWRASPIQIYRGGQVLFSDTPVRFPEEDPFVGEIRHFVECVQTDRPLLIPIDHSIRVLAACLHAVQSAETGRKYCENMS